MAPEADLAARYAAAAAATGPRRAAREPALVGDAYWIDAETYFFVERDGDGRAHPSLVEVGSAPRRLIAPEELAARLAAAGTPMTAEALARARFDCDAGRRLTVGLGAQAWHLDLGASDGAPAVPAGETFARPELYSPDGRLACFVEGNDLWLRERASGALRRLTDDGAPHHAYGQPSETGLAAISYRRRPYPVGLWSADSRWLVTHQIDERGLPETGLVEHVPPGGGRPQLHCFKAMLPGDPAPIATFVAIEAQTGRQLRFVGAETLVAAYSPFFLDRIWPGEESCFWLLRLGRYAREAELVRLDLADGTARIVHRETCDQGFLGFNAFLLGAPNVRVLEARGEFIWYSQADGWGHLYLHDLDTGACKRRLTAGVWSVRDLVHVDAARGEVLFLAGARDLAADPARRSLCRLRLGDPAGADGCPPCEVLFAGEGDCFVAPSRPWSRQSHPFAPAALHAGVAPGSESAALLSGSLINGDAARLLALVSTDPALNPAAAPSRLHLPFFTACPLAGDGAVRLFAAPAADGVTPLHGALFLPPGFDPARRYPLIDLIYPGPQVAQQPQFHQRLKAAPARAFAALGFAVMMLDTRGMPVSSRAFHQAGYPRLLEPQVADHAAVLATLLGRHAFLDPERIGIIGQSGGGAAAVRALCLQPGLYRAGIAACGNHNSSLYSALWSDTYRGPPGSWHEEDDNAALAPQLARPLLLISGDMDENVPLAQTLALADALIAANRDFELLVVPGAGHDVLRTSGYAQRRAWDFMVRQLMDAEPPAFDLRFTAEEQADFEQRFIQEFRQ